MIVLCENSPHNARILLCYEKNLLFAYFFLCTRKRQNHLRHVGLFTNAFMEHRRCAQRSETRGNSHPAPLLQECHLHERVRSRRLRTKRMKHTRGELIRTCRREDNHRARVPRLAPIAFRRTIGNRRMCIKRIARTSVHRTDLLLRCRVVRTCRPEHVL